MRYNFTSLICIFPLCHRANLYRVCPVTPFLSCPTLSDLANNKIKTMDGLKELKLLRKIDLGANRIRTMEAEQLSGLVNLEELWLGKNKIEKIQGLEPLVKLRRLDVQSNRLTVVEGLETQHGILEELYLAHNAITSDGAANGLVNLDFPNLNVLDLSRNRVTTTQPFAHLAALEELWLSGNQIATFDQVQPIAALPLDTIYLEYNPIQDDPLYRKHLVETIPALKQIDANLIRNTAFPTTTLLPVETEEQRIRKLQDMAIARARAETERLQQQQPPK
jgi:protein phosphatase 1 regulatory subunit 7